MIPVWVFAGFLVIPAVLLTALIHWVVVMIFAWFTRRAIIKEIERLKAGGYPNYGRWCYSTICRKSLVPPHLRTPQCPEPSLYMWKPDRPSNG